jgi:hypothetical protein
VSQCQWIILHTPLRLLSRGSIIQAKSVSEAAPAIEGADSLIMRTQKNRVLFFSTDNLIADMYLFLPLNFLFENIRSVVLIRLYLTNTFSHIILPGLTFEMYTLIGNVLPYY